MKGKESAAQVDILLKFAKYDWNRVQMQHQQELSLLASWWKESNIETRIPYARYRPVECFFYGMGMYFEPRFALARNIWVKWMVAFSLVDDAYDSYGKYEELQYFTKIFERFDIRAKNELPTDYMKTLYETVVAICAETEEEMRKEGRAISVYHTKEEFVKLVQNYDVQAQWSLHEDSLPTFDEYIETGSWSIGGFLTMALSMIGIEEADETVYQWARDPNNKIVRACSILGRLYDDMATDGGAEGMGQISGREIYMKQYGVSKEEAIEGYKAIIEAAWKDLNEAWMRPWPVAKVYFSLAFTYAIQMQVIFKEDDG